MPKDKRSFDLDFVFCSSLGTINAHSEVNVPKLDLSLDATSAFFVRRLLGSWLLRIAPALIPCDFLLRQLSVGMLDTPRASWVPYPRILSYFPGIPLRPTGHCEEWKVTPTSAWSFSSPITDYSSQPLPFRLPTFQVCIQALS